VAKLPGPASLCALLAFAAGLALAAPDTPGARAQTPPELPEEAVRIIESLPDPAPINEGLAMQARQPSRFRRRS
jgi:hypothetical protein